MDNFFDGKIANKFDFCTLIIPHYIEFQKILAAQILNLCRQSNYKINILDLGVGTGNLLEILSRDSSDFHYMAVDSSEEMLGRFIGKFNSLQNVQVEFSDALDFLNGKTKKFDVIINSWTFHNWDSAYRKKVIDLVFKALKENGVFLNAEKVAVDSEIKHEANLRWQLKYMKKVLSMNKEMFVKWNKHYQEDEKSDVILKESEFSTDLINAGFDHVNIIKRERMDAVLVATK
jgi:ubiquinone/menaquinone biosynthesis C-methylase UbiE